ncbi:MAG: crossover junction endodeoxyribonuclease RuvC [Saprospiraceae bacterium]
MNKIKRILGVDPGTNIMGYALIEIEQGNIEIKCLDILKMKASLDQPEKLKEIFERIQLLIGEYKPEEMAIEAPFYSKNVQSMLKLGRAQGVCIAAAMNCGVSIWEYSPKKIKQSITGNGNASKEQVASMLQTIVKQPFDSRHLDATDALATAICHHFQNRFEATQGKKHKDWKSFLTENPEKKSS